MLNAIHERGSRKMSGLLALFLYVAAILSFQAFMIFAEVSPWLPKHAPVWVYLALGFLLNRTILRGAVNWHPMTNNLQTVTNSKVIALLFWPFVYGTLLVRMFINWLL